MAVSTDNIDWHGKDCVGVNYFHNRAVRQVAVDVSYDTIAEPDSVLVPFHQLFIVEVLVSAYIAPVNGLNIHSRYVIEWVYDFKFIVVFDV